MRRAFSSVSHLHNKVAVVTGSTSGIGLGVAQSLARQGCRVLLNGFGDPSSALSAVRSVARDPKHVAHNASDLSRREGCERLMHDCHSLLGSHCDILVNNAGIQHVSELEKFPADKWDQIVAINMSAAFHTTQLALPHMRQKKWGRIINVSSVHGLVASVQKSAYVASKHGVIGLTKVVALETAGSGVTCVAVCPGWVRTPLVEQQIRQRAEKSGRTFEQEKVALITEKMPSGDFVEVEHIGDTVVFLCSPAAAQITGQAIVMDGGWVSQ